MELNINQNVSDTFYRYKMPALSAKIEGKGNGIKTVITNIMEISKRLQRKPIYVTKFFGCELGAQIHVDDKNDRYIVNGSHEVQRLQELLYAFIEKFVLCSACGNPETTLHVKSKSGVVNTHCSACGQWTQIDPRHRLTQFIIKNPPDSEAAPAGRKGKKGKKTRSAKDQQTNGEEEEKSPAGDDGHTSQSLSEEEDDDDIDWGEDTTVEAQRRRLEELSAMARSLTINTDVEKSGEERADIFFKLLIKHKEAGDINKNVRKLKTEADQLNLGTRAVLIVSEALMSNPKTIITDIKNYTPVFIQFTREVPDSEKAQAYVLGAMASVIDKYPDDLLKYSCHILKTLYDMDIIEEDVILRWFEKNGAKRYAKNHYKKIAAECEVMLKWLKEAEEESDEENDDEEEEEEEDDGDGVAVKPPSATINGGHLDSPDDSSGSGATSPKKAIADDESDDEFDIDAI